MFENNLWTMEPVGRPENTIQGDKYRFTLLTPCLIRMEYREDGKFEDRPTQIVWNRKFDPVEFRIEKKGEGFELFTDRMHVTYAGGPFTKNSLNLNAVGGQNAYGAVWYYGEKGDNLGGTARTLDEVDGECQLQEGMMSRSGCSQIDDSHSLVLDENGWTQVRTGDGVDIYVFAYGNDYKEALNDFYRLTGKTPMLPRYALGNWWSRYYAYTEDSYKALVTRFEKEKIPFSVGVLDMDWHLVEEVDPKYGSGWTGYTWNKKYYPDPERFMNWLHDHGMKISVNLHPAGGIRAFEEAYPAMAKELGDVDTEHEAPIDFDITSRKFLEAYFKCVLHPEENKGVDFWWIDWQQGNITKVPGLDPLWMLNHYHYLDNARDGKRPLTFSRYAGPGSHRYPVGFSGDSIVTWESLNFQPYFTSTASNIGYGWWSHDIGGFENTAPAHVYKRWCAFGLLSSHSRLHGSKSYRVPWAYDDESCDVVRFFTQLKCRMMPYLYREAARANARGTPMMRAMMMEFPDDPACDYLDRQYMLGDNVMVAPVFTEAGDVQFYLPEGRWTHLWHNDELDGSRWHKQQHGFLSLPVYVRDNTLLALGNNDQRPDYVWHEGTAFHLFNLQDGHEAVCEVPAADGSVIFTLKAARTGNTITVTGAGEAKNWTLCLRNVVKVNGLQDGSQAESEQGLVVKPQGNALTITL